MVSIGVKELKVKKTLKIFVSVFVSFVILNAVCFFYYNVPVHFESKTNSTDYVWEKGKFYSRGTEGFSWGRTDANGFNNISADNAVNPEILIMGTSHTEAFNVAQNENYSYLLGKCAGLNGNDMKVYNIGISGHRIATVLNNFENALKEFKPEKYVVIEVTTTELTLEEINRISEGNVKKNHSTANPLLVYLQKIPFVRCVYSQLDKMEIEIKLPTFKKEQSQPNGESFYDDDVYEEYETALNSLMKQIGDVAKEYGVQLIILHNSDLEINKNGTVVQVQKSEKSKMFEEVCRNNGIVFVDMYEAFAKNYIETYHLPHGFSNTAVGEGHLNKYGHGVIAKELYELILNLEGQNKVVE